MRSAVSRSIVFLAVVVIISSGIWREFVAAKDPPEKAAPAVPTVDAKSQPKSEAKTDEKKEPREVANSIGQKLVLIPAGEFLMGGPEKPENVIERYPVMHLKPEDFADEYPQHKVKITKPFFMCRHETTVGQFKKFIAETHYVTEGEKDADKPDEPTKPEEINSDGVRRRPRGPGSWGFNQEVQAFEGRYPKYNWKNPGFDITDDMPVVNVSWNDAQEFLNWLSAKEKKTYRLPTEAEWEYACRAGTTTQYSSGNDPDSLAKIANVADADFYAKFPKYYEQEKCLHTHDGHVLPAPVGSYPPNAFGLYDMHGNAWEWTNDWYGEDYYAKSPLEDPPGPAEGGKKVRRGGAWHTVPMWARSSFRNWNTTISRYPNLGFRVVMNAE